MRSLVPARSSAAGRKSTERRDRPAVQDRGTRAARQPAGETEPMRQEPSSATSPTGCLPEGLQTVMEAMSGFSLSDVVVHRNSAQPARMGALAFTQGSQIHLGPGEEQNLPHEAWHVVQQKQGRVGATKQLGGFGALNDSASLEGEADLMAAKAAGPGPRSVPTTAPRRTSAVAGVIQRRAANLLAGTATYAIDYAHPWAKYTAGAGGTCWLYLGKAVDWDKVAKRFVIRDYILPYFAAWLKGNLVLHRGVDVTHTVYAQAQQGRTPAKPNATGLEPDFTSDHSDTMFIPYSTQWDVALMGAKNPSPEDAQVQQAPGLQDQIGVVVRTVVGADKSIGLFDEGEIQVLAPAQGRATPIFGESLHYGQRIAGGGLDQASILRHLHERLDDPVWAQLGVGWFGSKVPDGVVEMRTLLAKGDWKGVLNLAVTKNASTDSDRHPQTAQLYDRLTALRARAATAKLI
ncbi:MAG: hypothetical protein JWP15_1907 [Alphaproteobacteria bacterium]|nr:hypothetical protein [Alphaproteobacteria bacterium]